MNDLGQAFGLSPPMGQEYAIDSTDPSMLALMQQMGQPQEPMMNDIGSPQDMLGGPVPQLPHPPSEQDIQELAKFFGLVGQEDADPMREFLSGPAGFSDPAYDEDFNVMKLLGG